MLPTPAVALLALDLGVVITASHNPPEYNGVKFFDRDGNKLTDAAEEEIEALLDEQPGGTGGGRIDRVEIATDSYLEHILERFGSDLSGLRIAVDCANGAYSDIAPAAFQQLGADVTPVAVDPDGTNINDGCGATDLTLLQETVRAGGHDLGIAFDGDGDRMLAVDERGEIVDGDQILAILALDLEVDQVAVTVMTNLGFHRLMEERGIRVVTTPVGDRYVLEALRQHGGILGGEQSGHVICLRDHVTGDGLAAALLLCGALEGRTLSRGGGGDAPLRAGEGEHPRQPDGGPGERDCGGEGAQREARRARARAGARIRHGTADPRARRGRNGRRSGGAVWYHRHSRQEGARLIRDGAGRETGLSLCFPHSALHGHVAFRGPNREDSICGSG